jgi:hypothetical protein
MLLRNTKVPRGSVLQAILFVNVSHVTRPAIYPEPGMQGRCVLAITEAGGPWTSSRYINAWENKEP